MALSASVAAPGSIIHLGAREFKKKKERKWQR